MHSPDDPPEDLFPRIIARITTLEKRAAMIRARFFVATTILSTIAMSISFRYAWESFAQSSFLTYAALLASDGGALIMYWREFTYSLLESMPLASVTLFLISVFILLLSLKFTMLYIRRTYHLPHTTQFA